MTNYIFFVSNTSQPTFTYSKLTIETLEQGMKYVNGVVLVLFLLTFNLFHNLF